MRIAIIGSGGFIGRNLCRVLEAEGLHELFLFGRSPRVMLGGAPYEQLDLVNREQVEKALRDIDLVYYLVSDSIPSSTWKMPLKEIETNLTPFVNFMESLQQTAVKKVAFVSSAGTIYGPASTRIKEDDPKHPFSPYGITKLAMEHFLNYFRVKDGLESDIYRVSNVYGPGQDTSKGLGLINTFLEKIVAEGSVTVFGKGEHVRNYIFVDDVARIMAFSAAGKLAESHVLNIASDDTLSISQIIDIIKKVVDIPFRIDYQQSRQSDNPAIIPDNNRLKTLLPAFSFTPIEDGITRTFQSIKEQVTK